ERACRPAHPRITLSRHARSGRACSAIHRERRVAVAGSRAVGRLWPGLAGPCRFRTQPPRDFCASGLVAGERSSDARAFFDRPARRRVAAPGNREGSMATVPLIDEGVASAEVRAVFDDIRATRKVDWINNFWKALANHPATLRRTWESVKQVTAPGALDVLTKEMIYLAVSATNGCHYCIASHTASSRNAGMTDAMLG